MSRQHRIYQWAKETFGEIAAYREERAKRFLEEALELGQACGISRGEIDLLADRVYRRPHGHIPQEIGQAMMTLEVLAANVGVDADLAAAQEFYRVQNLPREHFLERQAQKAIDKIGKAVGSQP